jgi:hypothetical protein
LDHRPFGVDDESHVEESVGPFGVAGFGLGHHVDVVLEGDLGQGVGLGAGDVDGTGVGEGGVIEIEHLVVEALQRPFGPGDQPHR